MSMVNVNLADAIAKYGKIANMPQGDAAAEQVGSTSFADIFKQASHQLTESQNKAEQVSMKAATGEANLLEVMTAINNAEMTLQTISSIRDRLVQAIQEVMRMPV